MRCQYRHISPVEKMDRAQLRPRSLSPERGFLSYLSVRLAKHGGERQHDNLFASLVADVQNPIPPIDQVRFGDLRSHEIGGLLDGLHQIDDGGAASVNQHAVRIRTVEINLAHGSVSSRSSDADEHDPGLPWQTVTEVTIAAAGCDE